MISFLIIFAISTVYFSNSFEISCNFKALQEFPRHPVFDSDEFLFPEDSDYEDFPIMNQKSPSKKYECVAKNLTTSFDNRTVTKIIGDHVNKMSNDDVQELTIHLQNTPFLPLKISDHFKNLKILSVIKSNVQHLMTGDLNGLEKLENLNLKNNPIKQIGHDFFQGMINLKILNFAECHLKLIDGEVLEPLKNLQNVDFRENDCIHDFFGQGEFTYMKTMIKQNCQGTHIPFKFDEECAEIQNEEQKDEEKSSSASSVLLISTVIILSLITTVLVYALIKIRKELQKSSWNEMVANDERF